MKNKSFRSHLLFKLVAFSYLHLLRLVPLHTALFAFTASGSEITASGSEVTALSRHPTAHFALLFGPRVALRRAYFRFAPCPTGSLPHYLAAPLAHCRAASPPYCLTFTSHFALRILHFALLTVQALFTFRLLIYLKTLSISS